MTTNAPNNIIVQTAAVETCAVLWDMDGVLVDTAEAHFETWSAALADEGILYDRATFDRLLGMNNADTLAAILGRPASAAELERIAASKEERFLRLIRGRAQLLPGVLQWLERFQALGCRQAVASSAPAENINALITELRIGHFFMALVSAHGLPGKPDPAVFLAAARCLDVTPAQCLVIEDSAAGVAAARRAGMICLAVQTTHAAAALRSATLIVPDLTHLSMEQLRRCRAFGRQPAPS